MHAGRWRGNYTEYSPQQKCPPPRGTPPKRVESIDIPMLISKMSNFVGRPPRNARTSIGFWVRNFRCAAFLF